MLGSSKKSVIRSFVLLQRSRDPGRVLNMGMSPC